MVQTPLGFTHAIAVFFAQYLFAEAVKLVPDGLFSGRG
jgi:hypothetical protein